ncbi:MAG: glucose-6-phosphate isomerase [Candidatus Micrarchaeota archaeon]|nr:glucose-6-phosphate isomerase [Candidatus Micrarchaeota archaeon]
MKFAFEGQLLCYGKQKIEPDVRSFGQMRPVLAFPDKSPRLSPDSPTYFMYRGVEKFGKIRYDITRILSLDLCGEKNKTYGHAHPPSKKGTAWPEIYEVLEGKAHFLVQKVSRLGVEDAVLAAGKKGEKFIIPPGYGHVTINAGEGDLVLANLVYEGFESDYSLFAMRRGACYYETKEGKLIKNKNYGEDFELRKSTATLFSSSFGCFSPFQKLSLLEAARDYRNIEFLEKPELFY